MRRSCNAFAGFLQRNKMRVFRHLCPPRRKRHPYRSRVRRLRRISEPIGACRSMRNIIQLRVAEELMALAVHSTVWAHDGSPTASPISLTLAALVAELTLRVRAMNTGTQF